jgi:YD repeat-containing protein
MKRFLSLTAVFLAFTSTVLAEHPNEAHGFSADNVYSVHDVDTVNAFNGNMIVRIPIGPEYKVNGVLSYRLSLTYNSHLWNFVDNTSSYDVGDNILAYPPKTDNAGLGWRLSMGKLYETGDPDVPNDPEGGGWIYQSGDGADHHFFNTLNPEMSPSALTLYSRDSSYMRLTSIAGDSTTKKVEFPDGTVHTFRQLQRADNTTWQTSTTSKEWFLTSMSDASGNTVSVAYSSAMPIYKEIWTITDGARTATAYFRSGLTADFTCTLEHIDMQAIGGAPISYSFYIQSLDVPTPSGDTSGRGHITVAVLTAVNPPAGNSYSMMLGGAPAYDYTNNTTSGVLTRLVLPTLGSVGWSYNIIRFGGITSHRSPGIEMPIGVTARTTYDANGTALGTWDYVRFHSHADFCDSSLCAGTPPCSSGRPRQMTVFITDPPADGVQKTTINYFSNFERIEDPNGESCPAAGWVSAEHGMPFTRYASYNQRFLSSDVRTGLTDLGTWDGRGQVPLNNGTRLRETYLTYRLDSDAEQDEFSFDHNAILSSSATYYRDDSQCGPTGNDLCFTATNHSVFDGYGHYKQASTEGNLPGTGNYRTTFTNYSAAPTPSTSWLLTPYTEQCTADETGIRTVDLGSCSALPGAFVSRTQFDTHGRLTARRTLLQSTMVSPADLLATFGYDGHGNLSSEQYYGGDMQALDGATDFAPPTTPAPYSINHTLTYWQFGGALTGDKATYGGNGVTVSDQSYDPWTEAVTDVRDVAGVLTHYNYDALGRVTNMQPQGLALTTYTYPDASVAGSVFTPAKVTAVTDASSSGIGSLRKEYQYDFFGRLWRQKLLLDDGVSWTIAQNDFDVLGRKSSVSMPEKLIGSESSFVPAHTTKYHSYDAFDRATNIEAPDGNTTSVVFTGIRSVQRTVNIATSSTGCSPSNGTGCTASMTEEIHDAAGRLYQVTEPSGPTSISSPVGANVTTTYSYDSADRLKTVSTLSQTRNFDYDHRGYLRSEQHPEVGVNGNALTQYIYASAGGTVGYDARGHAHGKLTGSINGLFDLRYDYDSAERLTTVTDSGDTRRPLKGFSYWTENDTANPPNLGRGKLYQAVRHNYPLGIPGEVAVTETYTYATPSQSGRISKRDTLVENVNGGVRTTLQTFSQNASYDQMGSLSQIDYPACGVACSSPSPTGPAYTRRNGFLIGVTGYASPITYNADGSVFEVTHDAAHGVKDTYTPDSSGMGRPGVISFAGATVPSCNATAAVGSDVTITAGQTTQIHADLSGTNPLPTVAAPWSITWSDGVTESVTQAHWTRNISYPFTRTYTITIVTDASGCSGTGTGSATVTVVSLPAPSAMAADATTTNGNITQTVSLHWNFVQGAAWYQIERATQINANDWQPIGRVTSTTSADIFGSIANPFTYLYRVRAGVTSGGADATSDPSAIDYATVATTLFSDEPLAAGVTRIKGIHIGELRHAIDAVRHAAGLNAAWSPSSYAAATGPITANDNLTARNALDEARSSLFGPGHNWPYTGETPARNGKIWAYQIQQIRDGVR